MPEFIFEGLRAALASNTIITMLPSSPHVIKVYSENIIPALEKLPSSDVAQTLCIDSTTLDVDVARTVASKVMDIGAQMVDAPVSGGKSLSIYRPISRVWLTTLFIYLRSRRS